MPTHPRAAAIARVHTWASAQRRRCLGAHPSGTGFFSNRTGALRPRPSLSLAEFSPLEGSLRSFLSLTSRPRLVSLLAEAATFHLAPPRQRQGEPLAPSTSPSTHISRPGMRMLAPAATSKSRCDARLLALAAIGATQRAVARARSHQCGPARGLPASRCWRALHGIPARGLRSSPTSGLLMTRCRRALRGTRPIGRGPISLCARIEHVLVSVCRAQLLVVSCTP